MGAVATSQLQAPHHYLKPLPWVPRGSKEADQGPSVLPERSSQGKEMFSLSTETEQLSCWPRPWFHLCWAQCDRGVF